MKKSTILSLATAIAVVGTSAFTFAAWDQLDATQSATLTYTDPVIVSMEELRPNGTLGGLGGSNTVNIPVNVTIDKYTPVADKDTIKLSLVDDNDVAMTPVGIDVVFKKSDTALTNNVDKSPSTGTNNYVAEVTLKDDATLATVTKDINVKAELLHVE